MSPRPPAQDRGGSGAVPDRAPPVVLDFPDNRLLVDLFGDHDRHLARIEEELQVALTPRGNRLAIEGAAGAQEVARSVLTGLYAQLERGRKVDDGEVDGAIRLARGRQIQIEAGEVDPDADPGTEDEVVTRKRRIAARSPRQAEYIDYLRRCELVFGLGPAGTGKTYLAVAVAVTMMLEGQVDRIILSRPAVEAGERLGFLPGDMKDKVDPYLRPLYDALYDMLPGDQVARSLQSGEIEVAPLAFMRGRTLANACVILDEAQNTTPVQMKMFLTRLGENSRMVITGDMSQIDLPIGVPSGLRDALDIVEGIKGIGIVRFTDVDVVRHPLVTRIVRAYAERDKDLGLQAHDQPRRKR
ncbi:MAG: PhoH family protein [Sneathiellaceae bacterium]